MSEPTVNLRGGMEEKNYKVIAGYFKLFLDERPISRNFNEVKIGIEPKATLRLGCIRKSIFNILLH